MGKIKFILLLLFGSVCGWGQDFLVSNYGPVAPQLNPALTGFVPGSATTRAGMVVREQWSSFLQTASYRTMVASFDHRICGKSRGDYFGIGALLAADWQGDPGLRRTDGSVSAAYTKNLNPKFYGGTSISIGAELGFIQYHLGSDGLTFDDQLGNPAAAGERLDYYQLSVLDYGAGMLFTWVKDARSSLSISGGLSIKHLGKPANTFVDDGRPTSVATDSSALLITRWTPHLTTTIPLAQRKSVTLSGIGALQRPHNQLLLRALLNFERPVRGQASSAPFLSLGGGYRLTRGVAGLNAESLIATARVNLGTVDLGLNYDINVSALRSSTSGFGGLELSMAIVFGKSDCLVCPSF